LWKQEVENNKTEIGEEEEEEKEEEEN